jgi:hypothetical protein
MFYTVYQITNTVNGKIYIGKHQSKELDDNYMGSGKQLRYAINKYGIENFTKEILFKFDNVDEMNAKEAELVTEEFCLREDTYNLCPGGNGGFGYINSHPLKNYWIKKALSITNSEETNRKRAETVKKQMVENEERRYQLSKWTQENGNGMLGKKHSDETKEKMKGPRGKYNVQKTGIKRGSYKKKNIDHNT